VAANGELGRAGAPCRGCSRWVSPARPPNPACDFHRTGLSACLGRWLCGRLGCPRGWYPRAAVAVAGDRHGRRAGEPGPVCCECPGAGEAEAPLQLWQSRPSASVVLVLQPVHDAVPCVVIDLAEGRLGHAVPEVARPPRQGPVDALEERREVLVQGRPVRHRRYLVLDGLDGLPGRHGVDVIPARSPLPHPADGKAEEVEALVNADDAGLFLREPQP
jgi:hypothetical protein